MASAADGADRPPIEQLDAEICAALEELASQLRCKACQQSFRAPYTLPCGHRFCRQCLDDAGVERCGLCGLSYFMTELRASKIMAAVIGHYEDFLDGLRAPKSRRLGDLTADVTRSMVPVETPAAAAVSDAGQHDRGDSGAETARSIRRQLAVLEQRMRAYSVLVLASMHGPLAGHISLPGLPLPDELVHASRHLDDEEALERATAVERSGMLALEQSYADDGGRTGPSGGLMSQREIAEQMDAPESACGEHSVPPEPPAEDERAQLPTGWMRPEQVTVQLPVGRDRPLETTLPSGQPALVTWGDTRTPSVAAPPGAEAGSGVEPMQSWRHGAGPGGVATAHRSPAPLAVLAEPSRSRVSSPVLLGTMLEQEELQLLRSLVKRFGGRVVGKTWSPEVTHVVSATKCGANGTAADERLCGRTIKFCGAVLSGQWIVGASWIRESAKHGFWVAEEAHEVHGDNSTISNGRGAGGPRRGRLRRERDEPRLFDGLCVYLHGSFVRPTRRELAQLVEYGGGVVVDRLPEVGIVHRARVAPPHRILVVCAELPADQSLRSRCAEAGLPAPVDHEWLFDSISKHKCMPWPEVDALHASDATPSQLSEVF